MKRLLLCLIILFFVLWTVQYVEAFRVNMSSMNAEVKWHTRTVPYYFNLTGAPAGAHDALLAAMQTWSSVPGTDFTFSYAGDTTGCENFSFDLINRICFGPTYENDVIAENRVWYNPNTGQVYDSDITFNTSYQWSTTGTPNAMDLQNIATHELGHSLSLGDLYSSTDSEKTMYALSELGETKKRTLDQDDMEAIVYLYPVAGQQCSYSLNPTTENFAIAGGTGSFSINTTEGCEWAAQSNHPQWLHITSEDSGNGSGQITYTVDDNTSNPPRTGTINLAGRTFTVRQQGCSYDLSPTSRTHSDQAGNGTIGVSTSEGCIWSAQSDSPEWLTLLSGTTGIGNGTVDYAVGLNDTPERRTGTIIIANRTFTVIQNGTCIYTLSKTSADIGFKAKKLSIKVTTSSQDCAWEAWSNDNWIALTEGTFGTGKGTVKVEVAVNNSGLPRTGTLTIAGQTYTVNQAGAPCKLTALPKKFNFANSAYENQQIAVNIPNDCPWTAVRDVDWIALSGGAGNEVTGVGPGTVTFGITENTSLSTRKGKIIINSANSVKVSVSQAK